MNIDINTTLTIEHSARVLDLQGNVLRALPPSRAEILNALWVAITAGGSGNTWANGIAVYETVGGTDQQVFAQTLSDVTHTFDRETLTVTRSGIITVPPTGAHAGRRIDSLGLTPGGTGANLNRFSRGFLFDGDDNAMTGETLGGQIWEFTITVIGRLVLPEGVYPTNIPFGNGSWAPGHILRHICGGGFNTGTTGGNNIGFGLIGGFSKRGALPIDFGGTIQQIHGFGNSSGWPERLNSRALGWFSSTNFVRHYTLSQLLGFIGGFAINNVIYVSLPNSNFTVPPYPNFLITPHTVPVEIRGTHHFLVDDIDRPHGVFWSIFNVNHDETFSVTGVSSFDLHKIMVPRVIDGGIQARSISPSGRTISGPSGVWVMPEGTAPLRGRFENLIRTTTTHWAGVLATDKLLLRPSDTREFNDEYTSVTVLNTFSTLHWPHLSVRPFNSLHEGKGLYFGVSATSGVNTLLVRTPEDDYRTQTPRILRSQDDSADLEWHIPQQTRISANEEWLVMLFASDVRFFRRWSMSRQTFGSEGRWEDTDRYRLVGIHSLLVSAAGRCDFTSDGQWLIIGQAGATLQPTIFRLHESGERWEDASSTVVAARGAVGNNNGNFLISGEENLFRNQNQGSWYKLINGQWIGYRTLGAAASDLDNTQGAGAASNDLSMIASASGVIRLSSHLWATLVVLDSPRDDITVSFTTSGIHKTTRHTVDVAVNITYSEDTD